MHIGLYTNAFVLSAFIAHVLDFMSWTPNFTGQVSCWMMRVRAGDYVNVETIGFGH